MEYHKWGKDQISYGHTKVDEYYDCLFILTILMIHFLNGADKKINALFVFRCGLCFLEDVT